MMETRGTKGIRCNEAGLGLGAPSPPQVTVPCPGLGTGVRGRGGGDANNSSGPAGMFHPGAAGEGGGEGQGVLPPPLPRVSSTAAPRAPPGRCCIPPAEGSSRPRSDFSARSSPSCPFPTPASGGVGGGGELGPKGRLKRGKKKDKHTPPKKPSPAVAGPPHPQRCPAPFGCIEWESPRGSRDARVGRCRDTHGPYGPHRPSTHVRTHIDTRGGTRGGSLSRTHGETRPRVGLGGGVPTSPSKSLRIPSRCSFTESRAMGGGWTRGRPAWEPQDGAEPERSSGSGRDGGGCPGLCGRGARGGGGGGERAGGGGEGCRGRGRRGEVLPASRPGRIPPTRIPQAWHRRVVPGGPVLSGPIAMLRPFPPLKATGRAGNPLPGPTEGSKGVSDPPSPSPGLLPAPTQPGPVGCGRGGM